MGNVVDSEGKNSHSQHHCDSVTISALTHGPPVLGPVIALTKCSFAAQNTTVNNTENADMTSLHQQTMTANRLPC